MSSATTWKIVQAVEQLKTEARSAGVWNFFMPPHFGQAPVDDSFVFEGVQLANLDYSLIVEQLGKISFASEVFNAQHLTPATWKS